MAENENISIDEFLSERKGFVKSGDVLLKASRGASTWDPQTRTVRFVMSAEVEDRDKDIVFQAGLDLTEFLKNPVAPFGHRSSDFPVGSWSNVEKMLTGRPKRTEGDLTLVKEGTDGVADRLAFHISQGTIRACSIGFIPKAVQRREKPEGTPPDSYVYTGYKILEAELVECSPVSIPSNPAALAKSAAEGDKLAKEIIEDVLDNWVKHPESGLIMPRSEFEAAHKQATGERTVVVVAQPPQPAETSTDEPAKPSLFRRALNLFVGEDVIRALDEQVQKDQGAEAQQVVDALKTMQANAERKDALLKRAAEVKERAAKKLAA